jgi:hypothetical protein
LHGKSAFGGVMISMNDFNKDFIERHDFVYDDSSFLSSKYPSIKFLNIPEAWVVVIDIALGKMREPFKIRSISQVMGHLSVDVSKVSDVDQAVLKWLEKKLIELDFDLHSAIEEGIVLH